MPTTYSNLESVSSATAAQNDPAVPPSLGPRNSELSWSKFARQYRSLNKSTTMPEATAEESSEPEPMDIECRLAGGALPDSGQMTVFVLLPNGTMIMLTMSTTVTFAEVKEEVFEVAASGPMYGALKDPSSYYFSYIDPTFAATKDATEESKSLAEVQPFGGMLKLLEAKEDMAATQLDEQIGRLIGKPLRDFDALRNAEVNEFRYKMRSLCEEIVKIRQGHSWLEKMKYAYPVAAESTAEVPKYLLGRLPPDGYIPVKVTFEQPDLTLELSVHHLTTPDEILTTTIRKLATDPVYSEAYAELLEELEADSYYDTSFETDNPAHLGTNYYLLKINGALEYLLHNHKLIQYRTIRQLLLNDAPIHMVAIRKNSIEFEDESIYSVPDFLPPPTPRNRSQSTISLGSLTSVLINAKRRHTTFSSWSIDRKLVIRIHSASRIGFGTDKDIGRIAIMAGIFHGGELLTEHFMTSPMSESLNKSAPNLVLLDTNLMSFTWELDIVFNLKVSDLPRMARLCFAVVGFPGGGGSGKKLSKAASVAALTAKPTAKLYWGNINFFDYKGNLRENSTTLALWPFDENNQDTSEDIGSSTDADSDQAAAKYFNPLGTVVQNPATAECPLLTISFTKYSEGENAIIRYPDLKEISKTYSSQAIQQTQSQHPQPSNMSSFPEESIEESEGDMTTAADVHVESEDVPTAPAPAESTFEPVPNVRRSASVSTPTSNANATAARTAWARKHSLAIDSKMAETIASAAAAANNPEMKSRIDSLQKRSASKQFLSKSCTSSTPTTSFQRPVKDLMPRTRVMLRFKKKEMMKKSSSSRMRKSSVFGDSFLKAIPEENEVEEQEMDKPSYSCIGDPSGVTVLEQQETGTQGFFTTKVEHIQAENEVVFQRVSRRKLSSQGQVQKQEQQSKSNSDDIEYLGFEVVEQDSAKECEEQQGCRPSRGGSFTKIFRRLFTTSSSNPKPAKVKAKDPTRFRSKSLPERPKPVVSSVPKRRSASFSLCKVLFGTKTKASAQTSPPPLPPLNELRDNLFFYLEQIGDFCDRDLLYRMTDQECELLWYLKDDCKRLLPNALNKLLLSFKWNQQKSVGQVLTLLQDWPKIPPSKALELLDYAYPDSFVRKYAIECLKDMTNEQLSHFLLQLVQALKYESYIYNDLVQFLLERAFESQRIGHQLFWLLRAEMHDPAVSVHFGLILEAYCRGAVDHIHILTRQSECLSKLVRINEIVRDDNSKSSREKRIGQMQDILSQKYYTESLSNVINPLDPAYKLGALQSRRCKFMDSKMKPLWLVFDNAENRGISGSGDIFLIFKNGDDLRQDMLTLQMLRIMDQMWKEEGLDLRMTPYQCVSLAKNVGLIEVVLNADTIANIQKEKGSAALAAFKRGSLYSWIRDHNPGEDALKKACEEFTLSCAGYCVATYILGIADRHSDNIMVKRNGQLFHIDFGHILGKFKEKFGIRRERVPFVLTHDFVYVITHGGQDKKTEHFDRFQAVCEQAFLIIRRRGNFIISLFAMMLSTGIPEVSSVDDLQYLRETLVLDLSEEHARTHFRAKFTEALKNSWKTSFNWCAHSLAKDNRMAE